MAPQEIAMLCSCEIGQESFPDGICDLFLVFLNGWKKKLDGVCVFTLGRRLLRWDRAGRPLYLYSPWTSIHILTWTVIQCGDTFYRSDGRSNHKAHTGSSASRFPFRCRVCLFLSTNDSVACRPGTLISQIIHTYNGLYSRFLKTEWFQYSFFFLADRRPGNYFFSILFFWGLNDFYIAFLKTTYMMISIFELRFLVSGDMLTATANWCSLNFLATPCMEPITLVLFISSPQVFTKTSVVYSVA